MGIFQFANTIWICIEFGTIANLFPSFPTSNMNGFSDCDFWYARERGIIAFTYILFVIHLDY